MDSSDLLPLISRWLHILSAIAAVGGTAFMRLALVPSVGVLSDESRKSLHESVRSRWSKVVLAAILFLLVSGLYNFALIEMDKKVPPDDLPLYRGLFGVKFLLALAIFFIASALLGRSAAFASMRAKARTWLTVNLVLAVVLVCISGFLRLTRDKALSAPAAAASEAAVKKVSGTFFHRVARQHGSVAAEKGS